MMDPEEYDVAGFTVGLVDEKKILDIHSAKEGDVIIGLPSSGVHSNGFSLVRKVFHITDEKSLLGYRDQLGGKNLGEVLLTPTKLYVRPVLNLLKEVPVKSIAHITGGGFYENLPRSYGEDLDAEIEKGSWDVLPIFRLIQKEGKISEHDLYNTFNMGIGMTVIVDPADAQKALASLKGSGVDARIIGKLVRGSHTVVFQENA
jgi:phosphoribosylformylglycinamidine cyclo-ligase